MRLNLDVPALLAELGIEARKAGDELRGYCPNPIHIARPGSSAATKTGPGTWQIKVQGRKAGWHVCHSCGFGGGPVTLVKVILGFTGPDAGQEAWRWLRNFCGLSVPSGAHPVARPKAPRREEEHPLPLPEGARRIHPDVQIGWVQLARKYLLDRGVTDEEILRWEFTATPPDAPKYSGRVIVPVKVEGKRVDFVARLWRSDVSELIPKALSGRIDLGAQKEWALWGYDALDPTLNTVVVVEGVWDALYLLRHGIPNVTACCGSAWSPERTELLAYWPEVILLPDGDEAGRKLVQRASSLRYASDVRVGDLPPGKQPEDLSMSDLRAILRAAQPPTWHPLTSVKVASWTGKGV